MFCYNDEQNVKKYFPTSIKKINPCFVFGKENFFTSEKIISQFTTRNPNYNDPKNKILERRVPKQFKQVNSQRKSHYNYRYDFALEKFEKVEILVYHICFKNE
jgi:DnaJ-domain-containing protein 1